ncbi:MAG TPA: cation:proton antiporter [Pyrinomonadaceae bacterium]|jgi:Kef-type K+ transport system membrane component KefB
MRERAQAGGMRRSLVFIVPACALIFGLARTLLASTGGGSGAADAVEGGPAHGLEPRVLLGVAVILIAAKLGGEVFERFGQPAVLGELIIGILIGNLSLAGLTAAEPLKTDVIINALAELGVIILLFEVGLESNLGEMLEVGWSSLAVAVAGVVVPFLLGWGVAAYFIPGEARLGHIFIGATLSATSVGITARVLKDMKRLQTRESRIILGAAVIDDVLGLLILAVVAGSIKATASGGALSVADVAIIAGKSVAFLVGAVAVGHYLTPQLFQRAGRFESRGVLLALSIAFCFLLAWAAAMVGLAPIVGAFAAGLVLDEVHFETFPERGKQDLQRLITPVSTVLVPIFFVLMGLKVELGAFARPDLLGFAAALTLAAIIGKQVCSLAVMERGLNRLAVGLGMIPRGEVGLIFAGIGATLMLPNAEGVNEPVISPGTFGVVVIMVIVTTLVTPPALKWALARTTAPEQDESTDTFREIAEEASERISH